jgi:hypothetical protein
MTRATHPRPRARPHNDDARRLGGRRAILVPTLPYFAPVPGALAAMAFGVISRPAVAAVAASALVCGLVRATLESIRIETLREHADRWLATRTGRPPSDDVLLGRIRELTDPRSRATLANSVRRLVDDAESTRQTLIHPNRHHLGAHRQDLSRLAHDLGDLSHPVAPRGVALAYRLITAAGSPLYNRQRAGELRSAVRTTIAALDGPPHVSGAWDPTGS